MIKSVRYLIGAFIVLLLSPTWLLANSAKDIDPKLDSITRSSSLYFKINRSAEIDSLDNRSMNDLVNLAKNHETANIRIEGWADKSGNIIYNQKLSLKRAEYAKSYLIGRGVDESFITTTIGMGVDSKSSVREARRATIYLAVPAPPKQQTDEVKMPVPPPKPEVKPEIIEEPIQEPISIVEEPVQEPASVIDDSLFEKQRGKFAIRTNLLYWLGASINAGFEWNPASTSLGVIVNGGYAPLGHNGWKYNMGGWFVSPELRLYVGSTKQWFVGAEFLAGGYNFKLSDNGYQGYTLAGGVTGGYKIELSKTFDMDFSLGLGYGTLNYDKYYHCDECDINVKTGYNLQNNTIMPIQAGIGLIWKIR